MNRWELLLIEAVVIPVLNSIADILEMQAQSTPGKGDDILAGAFRAILVALKEPAELFGGNSGVRRGM